MIVRGSSFASCKVAVTGNVCIWVGTEGVLGKLHDLLIRHGEGKKKKRLGRMGALKIKGRPLPSCWVRLGRAESWADPAWAGGTAPSGFAGRPKKHHPAGSSAPEMHPTTDLPPPSLFQSMAHTLNCFPDAPCLLPCFSANALPAQPVRPAICTQNHPALPLQTLC